MTAPIPLTITQPLLLDLTRDFLLPNGRSPLYSGALWIQRFQVRDENNVAKSVSGATIVMTITDGTTTVTRHTGTTSSGASAAQVVTDADQTTEDTDNYTGKGWFQIRFDAVAADKAFLDAFLTYGSKRVDYELAVKFGDATTQVVLCAGKIDILQPKNTFPLS